MRPKGQSTLFLPLCLGIDTFPWLIDVNSVNSSQTMFGVEKFYLRPHMGDDSYLREWTMHRMLARFSLPYLRTRTVLFKLNNEVRGVYTLMEAPDQDYVFHRSYPGFNWLNHGLWKVKTARRPWSRKERTLLPSHRHWSPSARHYERDVHRRTGSRLFLLA